MTRLNTSTRLNDHDAPRRVAAVHRQGDQISALLAEVRSGRIHVVEHQTLPARDADRLAALLTRWAAERVVRVLPGGSVVCRVLEIPPLDDAAAAEAAQLQAEAELPAMLPGHRRAVALMPWRTPVDNRIAIAFGWPGEQAADWPSSIENVTCCAEAAALLELLVHSGINQGTIASLDRDQRSMELAAHLEGVTAVRTARLSEAQWSTDAARIAVETAMSAGASDEALADLELRVSNAARAQRQVLVVEAEVLQRLGKSVSGAGADGAWWNRFGLCAGAALAAMGPRRGMAELLPEAPEVVRGPLVSALNWLSDPARARRVAIVALLLILAAPILGGWTRLAILEYKTRGLQEVEMVFKDRQAEADFFRTLRSHRWPMTKILADIAGMAPYDIAFDSINIDSSSMVTVSGSAPLTEQSQVLEFHSRLNESSLFAEVKAPNFTWGENKIEFELQAVVANATAKVKRPSDEPLATVLYDQPPEEVVPGEYNFSSFSLGGFSPPSRSPRNRSPQDSGGSDGSGFVFPPPGNSSGVSPGAARSSTGASSTTGSGTAGGSGSSSPPKGPPPPLTDEQIGAMNEDEVQKALLARAAIKYSDPRLQEEWNKLLERKRQLSSQPSPDGDDFEP